MVHCLPGVMKTMRMRKRHNLAPRMERCAELLVTEPEALRGRWLEAFPGFRRAVVELGCGKGRFTAETAALMPDTLYIAVARSALPPARSRGGTSISATPGPRAGTPSCA